MTVVKLRTCLEQVPRQAVELHLLEIFQTCLDKALINLFFDVKTVLENDIGPDDFLRSFQDWVCL